MEMTSGKNMDTRLLPASQRLADMPASNKPIA
jgi:hypothetical protein